MSSIVSLRRILGFSSVVTAILLWYVLSRSIPPIFVPSPKEVFVGSYELYKGVLGISILSTLLRVLVGFIIGSGLGILLAFAMAWNKFIQWVFDPIIEFIRPIPAVALIPLFILWLGLGEFPRVIIIVFAAFVVLVVSTFEAIKNVPVIYLNAARTLGADTKIKLFQTVIFPAVIPELIAGIRIAAAASFDLAAAAEFIGAQRGIGYIIINAERFLYTNGVIFGIFLFSSLAWVLNLAIRYFDRRINVWTEREKM